MDVKQETNSAPEPTQQDSQIKKSLKFWDSDQVGRELEKKGHGDVVQFLRDRELEWKEVPLSGKETMEITSPVKDDTNIKMIKLNPAIPDPSAGKKVFNDPIHGHIALHPLCVKIIDTPQFQRLRFIKQLGTCYFVYPGAAHNRFEHSLGVCHLAGRLLRAIQGRQPQLGISEKDVLCVEIAGLCHDLGHGPFSHLFDRKFIPEANPDTKWKHEDASKDMFEYLIKENDLREDFNGFNLELIKELMVGVDGQLSDKDWPYKGIPRSKGFLFEIVANKRNGIDVDKWDYFARDCYMLGVKNNFDHNRCIEFARVIEDKEQSQICYRDKEAHDLYEMFHTRYSLYKRASRHRVGEIVDTMITDALVKADEYIRIEGKDGKKIKMSMTIDDMRAYCQLTDHIFFQIYDSERKDLKKAKEILHNIMKRKLYKFVGMAQLTDDEIKTEQPPKIENKTNIKETIKTDIIKCLDPSDDEMAKYCEENLVVNLVPLDYGMQKENPMDSVRFYRKFTPDKAEKINIEEVYGIGAKTFYEQQIHIYNRDLEAKEDDMKKLTMAFVDWCNGKKYVYIEVKENHGTGIKRESHWTSKQRLSRNGQRKKQNGFGFLSD